VFCIRNYRWQLLLFSEGCIEIQHAAERCDSTQKNIEKCFREHKFVSHFRYAIYLFSVERHGLAQGENCKKLPTDHQLEQNQLLQRKR
jgi:hypothetical protein